MMRIAILGNAGQARATGQAPGAVTTAGCWISTTWVLADTCDYTTTTLTDVRAIVDRRSAQGQVGCQRVSTAELSSEPLAFERRCARRWL